MIIYKKSLFILLPIVFFSNNVYAIKKCLTNVKVTSIGIGYVGTSGSECPDDGNCIIFDYKRPNGTTGTSYAQEVMNLNDGGKGTALYDALKTAMILGYKIDGWSSMDYCTEYPQIDGIKLKPEYLPVK